MNFKTTLVLLVVLIAVAGAFLMLRTDGPSESEPADTVEPIVTGRDFRSLTLRRGDESITLRQEANGWWQTQPYRFPVTNQAVEQIINAALLLSPRQTFYNNPSAEQEAMPPSEQLGFAPPQAVFTLISDTGTHLLELGRVNLAGTGYLRRQGEAEVYLVDATLHQAVLEAKPDTWRPETLPTLNPQRVKRVKVKRDDQAIELTRTGDGWSLTPDGLQRAEQDAAFRLAQIGTTLKPLAYISDDPDALSGYGLDDNAPALSVTDASGQTQTLRLGRPADLNGQTVYANWSDGPVPGAVVFTLPTAYRDETNLTPDALRDPRLVTALPGAIRGQRVQRIGRDTIEITQTPGRENTLSFSFVEPQPSYTPDAELAPKWLTTLITAEPVGYTEAPREAQAPLAVVELLLAGDRSETVRLYADRQQREGDAVLVVRENETIAALVSRDQLAPLLAPVITLRDRRLSPTPETETIRLTRDDGHVFSFHRHNDVPTGWRLEGVEGNDWETADFQTLAAWLDQPRAAAWTAMPGLPRGPMVRVSLGPDRPAYVVNVDQGVAQRTDLPGVFRLPQDINALLKGEFRQRLVLPYRADQVQSLTLTQLAVGSDDTTAGDSSDTLSRSANGDFVGVDDPAHAATLLDALAGLNAKRFVPPPTPEQRKQSVKVFSLTFVDGQTTRLKRFQNGVWQSENAWFFIDAELDTRIIHALTPWMEVADTAE